MHSAVTNNKDDKCFQVMFEEVGEVAYQGH